MGVQLVLREKSYEEYVLYIWITQAILNARMEKITFYVTLVQYDELLQCHH